MSIKLEIGKKYITRSDNNDMGIKIAYVLITDRDWPYNPENMPHNKEEWPLMATGYDSKGDEVFFAAYDDAGNFEYNNESPLDLVSEYIET